MNLDNLNYEEHEDFNQSIDDDYPEVDIYGEKILSSYILFNLRKETYRIALTDFENQQTEDFKQRVYNYYPSPIAYYFRQTHYGYLNNNNRLQFLRSTWEAMIFVLYAIVVGEARKKLFPLKRAGINEPDLYNFSVDKKLSIIKKILTYNKDNNLDLKCGIYFDVNKIIKIKELNYERNGFQHTAALSEEQAGNIFSELMPDVIEALKSISQIENIELFHFLSTEENPFTLKCETFIGQSPNRTLKTYIISAVQLSFTGAELNNQNVFAKIDDDIFAISPFLHYISDDDGHLTNLCYLHQYNPINEEEFKFEIVRRSKYVMIPVVKFNDRIRELKALSR